MTAPHQPDFEEIGRILGEAAGHLNATLAQIGYVLSAQGAFGWMYRGDLTQARAALVTLPADVLRQVSTASAALSGLADELLTERAQVALSGPAEELRAAFPGVDDDIARRTALITDHLRRADERDPEPPSPSRVDL